MLLSYKSLNRHFCMFFIMKRHVILKEDYYHIGIFSDYLIRKNLYEYPIIEILSCFLRAKPLRSVAILASNNIKMLENGKGIVLGEIDALYMCRNEKLLLLVEIKNRKVDNLEKKLHNLEMLLRYILKWS